MEGMFSGNYNLNFLEPKLETEVVVVKVDGVTEGKIGVEMKVQLEEVTGQGK